MANEEWKPVNGAMHLLVSNYGRVMNSKTGNMLAPRKTKTGYLRVHMPMKHGKRKDAYIHRLVAEAFCYHPDGYDVINHIDFDITNNCADNLEWTTQKENVLYSMDKNRYPSNIKATFVIGEKNGIKYIFHSANEAAIATGCDSKSVLRSCKLGRRMRNGFLWKKVG